VLGAVIGDIVGSIYEHDNHRSKDFELFGEGVTFTDDTVLTVAVADALLDDKPVARTLAEWAWRYPGRGYGARFSAWLESWELTPYGSFGNGAAMRVSPAALLARSPGDALELARRVTEPTHDHPEGLKGAAATVHAIWLARTGEDPNRIRAAIASGYGYDMSRTVDGIRKTYRYNETCQGTVPQALTCALEARDFEDAIRNAISIGGDSDTIAAIAGPVAEARFGIPGHIVDAARRFLPEPMAAVLARLYERAGASGAPLQVGRER